MSQTYISKQVELHKLALGEHVGTSYVNNALGTLHEVYDGVRVIIGHLHDRGVLKWHLEDSRRLLSKHIYKASIYPSAHSKHLKTSQNPGMHGIDSDCMGSHSS